MAEIDKINKISEPLRKYLEENHDPYTEIVVSQDGVKVVKTVIGIPYVPGGSKRR